MSETLTLEIRVRAIGPKTNKEEILRIQAVGQFEIPEDSEGHLPLGTEVVGCPFSTGTASIVIEAGVYGFDGSIVKPMEDLDVSISSSDDDEVDMDDEDEEHLSDDAGDTEGVSVEPGEDFEIPRGKTGYVEGIEVIYPEQILADLDLDNDSDLPPGTYHYDGFAVQCTKLK